MLKRAMLFSLFAMSFATAAMSGTYPQPEYVSFSPTSGPPGTVITFNGSGFTGLNSAWIGKARNAAVHVVSDILLKVTVPSDATTATVGLLNPQHSKFTSQNFTVTTATPAPPQPPTPPAAGATTVSGTVTGAANTTVGLTGAATRFAIVNANASGNYSFTGVKKGVYTLAPNHTGHVYTPASIAATVSGAPVAGIGFSGAATNSPTYSITGTISGTASTDVTVTLNGANVGSAATDLGGNYGFFGLEPGTYSVSAALNGHTFSRPKTVTIRDVDSVTNNFSSTATPGGNAITIAAVNPLRQATVGKAYSASVLKSVSGGTGTYHYQPGTYVTGTPPLGMILNTNGTLTGTPKTAGKYSFTICAIDSSGDLTRTCDETSITVGSTIDPPPPPPPPPPTSGTSWVYHNGVLDWPGDYSFMATTDYTDSSGAPLSGPYDIKVTSGAWGGWQPYALHWNFNSAPYTKLTFALKPTATNQKWHVYFMKVGDIPVGISVDVSNYGPAPVAGNWATYTIPLADLGVLGTAIYKFCIQDKTGLSNNTWYVDNVGFVP